MEMQIFSVFDTKATIFLRPMFFRSNGEAIRAFTAISEDKDSQIAKFPEDFMLFHIGTYDDNTGKIVSTEPKSFGSACHYVKRKPEQLDIPVTC